MLSGHTKENPLVSLTGEILHQTLVNVVHNTASTNYSNYLSNPTAPSMNPVFITEKDEEVKRNASNWTITKIKTETFYLLDHFPDKDLADIYRNVYATSVARSNKDVHVYFYKEMRQPPDTINAT